MLLVALVQRDDDVLNRGDATEEILPRLLTLLATEERGMARMTDDESHIVAQRHLPGRRGRGIQQQDHTPGSRVRNQLRADCPDGGVRNGEDRHVRMGDGFVALHRFESATMDLLNTFGGLLRQEQAIPARIPAEVVEHTRAHLSGGADQCDVL